MARNDLAWMALELIDIIDTYGDALMRFVADGARARLDRNVPGFREKTKADQDARAQADARRLLGVPADSPKES